MEGEVAFCSNFKKFVELQVNKSLLLILFIEDKPVPSLMKQAKVILNSRKKLVKKFSLRPFI